MKEKKFLGKVLDWIKVFFGKHWKWGLKFSTSVLAIWKLIEIIVWVFR